MITLTFQFETVEGAVDFLAAVNGRKSQAEVQVPDRIPAPVENGKKERKPRSDAGQPRGPYKRKDETDSPESEATAAAPANVPAETPPAVPAAAAAVPAPKTSQALTLADVRAAMTGRSTEKNIALLGKFGHARSSDLDPSQYADFIAACKRGE